MFSALTIDDWIDRSDIRSGREALHKKYGPAVAVLTATGLLETAHQFIDAGATDLPQATREALQESFARGVLGIQVGQEAVCRVRHEAASAAEMDRLAQQRCGHLVSVAMKYSAWLPEDESVSEILGEAGLWAGMALQHRNDIQDYTVAFEQNLKPPLGDLLNGHPNLVLTYLFEESPELLTDRRSMLAQLYGRARRAPGETLTEAEFDGALEVLSGTGAIARANGHLIRCVEKASEAVKILSLKGRAYDAWCDYACLLRYP